GLGSITLAAFVRPVGHDTSVNSVLLPVLALRPRRARGADVLDITSGHGSPAPWTVHHQPAVLVDPVGQRLLPGPVRQVHDDSPSEGVADGAVGGADPLRAGPAGEGGP